MAEAWYDAGYANSSATLRLHVYTVENSASGNYTVERADVWMRVNANWGYYNNYGTNVYVGINGNDTNRTVNFDARVSAGTQLLLLGTWDTKVWHNDNGDASIGVSCSHATGVGLGTASGSWTYYCDHLNRYANFTNHYVESRTMNTIRVHWGADANCNYLQYSINGGGWTDASGYPTYTISNLLPNTSYNIRTRIRRADNGLWTESGYLYTNTLDMAQFTNFISTLKIGKDYLIQYSNPSNASVEIGIFQTDGKTPIIDYKKYSNNTIMKFSTEDIKKFYKFLGDNESKLARIYIRSTQNGNKSWNGKDITIKLSGGIKTVIINDNGVNKKGIIWVGTENGNKSGIFIVGTTSGYRRGI